MAMCIMVYFFFIRKLEDSNVINLKIYGFQQDALIFISLGLFIYLFAFGNTVKKNSETVSREKAKIWLASEI